LNVSLAKQEANELVERSAADPIYYGSAFFPRTIRQTTPPFHGALWNLFESRNRLCSAQVFRGGAKTTFARIYSSKRIAYGVSHTILYIGASERKALESVRWLKRNVEKNHLWSSVFGLRPGKLWQDSEIQINHTALEEPISVVAFGISSNVRGINIDDYRPDLIILDDILNDETANSMEQREKAKELIHGAIKESLAPASESPDAKIVALFTPLQDQDPLVQTLSDPSWASVSFGCWTPETKDLPPEMRESIWPERWPSQVLRDERNAAIFNNTLSIFSREKECVLMTAENAAFLPDWLTYYELKDLPSYMPCVIAIDPVPPPSQSEIDKGFKGKDYEALAVVGYHDNNYYLLDYKLNRGHAPDWTLATVFELAARWKPLRITVEGVAYQKTLSWLLEQAMIRQRKMIAVEQVTDKRKKEVRIVDALTGPCSHNRFLVRREQTEFINQFLSYSKVRSIPHDDLLDAVAMGMHSLTNFEYLGEDDWFGEAEDDVKQIEFRGCP